MFSGQNCVPCPNCKENRKSSGYSHEWGKLYPESFMPSSEHFIALESELMSNFSSLHMPTDL